MPRVHRLHRALRSRSRDAASAAARAHRTVSVARSQPERSGGGSRTARRAPAERAGREAAGFGFNERLRFYRYRPGQQFVPHMDHWHRPAPNQVTLHTVLAYFNDDFEGGETRFSEQLDQVVVPRAGLVAIFQHKLRHEGCVVRRGSKYAMRTEVLFEADEPIGFVDA